MKNAKGGYVLIYVVFVIIILCAIVAGVCTSALGGVKRERAAVEQLQSRYAAESVMEKFMAKAAYDGCQNREGSGFDSEQAAINAAKAEIGSIVGDAAAEFGVTMSERGWSLSGNRRVYGVSAFVISEDWQIWADIEFDLLVNVSEDEGEYAYTITGVASQYLSYDREKVQEGGAP